MAATFFDVNVLVHAYVDTDWRSEGCGTPWSEDMRHGQVIDGRLTIRDPFRAD